MNIELSEITKTVGEILDAPSVSEPLKDELRKHPRNWCVMLAGDKVLVAPPQTFEITDTHWHPNR